MEGYDILMLILMLASILYGAHKGLAWQVASIASMFASYGAAYRFRGEVARLVPAEAPWNMFLAMFILYSGSSLGIWLFFRLVKDFIERMKLKEFDQHMGALLGLIKGAILCSLVTLFAVTLLGDAQRQAIVRAQSGHYIARLLRDADPIMPTEVREVLDPYLDRLEERLEDVQRGVEDETSSEEWSEEADRSRDTFADDESDSGTTEEFRTIRRWTERLGKRVLDRQ